jgi:hypothetical protein
MLQGVALEVALQAALALGHRQVIVGQHVVIHADVAVARVLQRGADHLCQHQLFLRFRQRQAIDGALWQEALRQVRIVVAGDAVRAQADHLAQGLAHAAVVLVRQAVDQVEAQGAEAVGAHGLDEVRDLVVGLQPVHGLLHALVEVLDTEADAVEADPLEKRYRRRRYGARVDFDRVLPVALVEQAEIARQRMHELRDLTVVEVGRRAAAPVHLRDRPSAPTSSLCMASSRLRWRRYSEATPGLRVTILLQAQ